MGRNRNKLFYGAVPPALSPVQELSSESRSPTPASDHGDYCSATPKSDAKTNKPDVTPDGSSTDVVNQSFTDFLMDQLEEYREQTMRVEKQLRQEKQKNEDLQKKVKYYKTEYNNYRLSWTMDQAKIKELTARLLELEKLHAISTTTESRVWERHDGLTSTGRDTKPSVDNGLLKNGQSTKENTQDTTEHKSEEVISTKSHTRSNAKSERTTDPKSPHKTEIRSPKKEDRSPGSSLANNPSPNLSASQRSFLPLPPSRTNSRTGSRRPYTGRSRDTGTPRLPAITDAKNNQEHYRTAPSPQSPTLFPMLVPNRGMVFPMSSTSLENKKDSKEPVILPHLRGTSSTGSVTPRRMNDHLKRGNH